MFPEIISIQKLKLPAEFDEYIFVEDLLWNVDSESMADTTAKLCEAVVLSKYLFPYILFTASKVWKRYIRSRPLIHQLVDALSRTTASTYYLDLIQEFKEALNKANASEQQANSATDLQLFLDDKITPEIEEMVKEEQGKITDYMKKAASYGSVNIFKFLALNNKNFEISEILKDAVRGGKRDILAMVLTEGADLGDYIKTSIKYHHLWIIDKILAHNKITKYFSVISIAFCEFCANTRMAYLLFSKGFNRDAIYKNENALILSSQIVLRPMVDLLLQNISEPPPLAALTEAVKRNDLPIIKSLVEAGADINKSLINAKYSPSPICIAIERKIDDIFSVVAEKIDPNETTFMLTPALMAFKTCSKDILLYLLTCKIKLTRMQHPDKSLEGPLLTAARFGTTHHVEYLLKRGARINQTSPITNETPLIASIGSGRLDIAGLLISRSANINMMANFTNVSDWPQTALSLILETGNYAKIPLAQMATVQYKAVDLNAACKTSNIILMQKIADSGISMNEVIKRYKNLSNYEDENVITPFFSAILTNDYTVVDKAIVLGAKVNEKLEGMTPLGFAIYHGCVKSVMALIENGADMTDRYIHKEGQSETAMEIAAAMGDVMIMQYLVALYVATGKSYFVNSPSVLIRAVLSRSEQAVEYLLSLQVDTTRYAKWIIFHRQNIQGPFSALNAACNNLDRKLIQMLLATGAVPDQNDYIILSKNFPDLISKMQVTTKEAPSLSSSTSTDNFLCLDQSVIDAVKNDSHNVINSEIIVPEKKQKQSKKDRTAKMQPANTIPNSSISLKEFAICSDDFPNLNQVQISWQKFPKIPTFQNDSLIC